MRPRPALLVGVGALAAPLAHAVAYLILQRLTHGKATA